VREQGRAPGFTFVYARRLGVEMATGTRNPNTRRVLPDKEAGME
jgi:hypothetical protein